MLKTCFKVSLFLISLCFLVACGSSPKKPVIVIEKPTTNTQPVLTEEDKARYQEALGFMAKESFAQAEPIFKELISAHPTLTGAYVNLGVIKKANKQTKEAQAFFTKALEVNPNFVDALLQQALIMQDVGEFTKAEDLLRRAEVINPNHPLVQYNLGVLYELYLQDYALAIKHYERYVQLSTADDVETVKRWIMLLERK